MSDNDTSIELNRRRVLGGIATIGAASAALGAGTFAYFTDEVESNDNSISAGTLTLELDGSSDWSYTFDDIAPGDPVEISANLENVGSIDGSHIIVETSTDGGSNNLATQLDIDEVRWNDNSVTVSSGTLEELANENIEVDATPANEGGSSFEIDMTFNSNAGNDYKEESVDVDHTFTLYQDSSQPQS